MRALFCGGGTGGHIYPALAMADILRQNFKNVKIAFVGRTDGAENRVIIQEGEKLYTLQISGLKRKLSLSAFKSIVAALRARKEAKRIIKDFAPDIIIGTGGYVSWPVLDVGIRMGIPCLLHESNAYPGLVTRMLGHKCTYLLLNQSTAVKHLKSSKNIIVCGNPIRKSFKTISRDDARKALGIAKDELLVISFGGSLGAEKINSTVVELIQSYGNEIPKLRHIHATGRNSFERYSAEYGNMINSKKYRLVPYIENMPLYLSAADLAITRSGALTLSELSYSKVPAILIPSPNVAENHQHENAKVYERAGGAMIITEEKLSCTSLRKATMKILKNGRLRKEMSEKIGKLCNNETENLVTFCVKNAIKSKADISASI